MKVPKFFALLTRAALLLAACAPQAAAPTTAPVAEAPTSAPAPTATEDTSITLTDDFGRTITLAAPPTRIVSTAASLTETLFALGAGDLVVGRDEFSVYPEAALDIPIFGSLWGDFPAEGILGLEPDLVLAAEIISADQIAALEALGLTVYWQKNPLTFEDLYQNVREIGALTGRTAEAEALAGEMQTRVDAVLATVAAAETQPVVFYELDATDPNNPWTTGSGTFIDLIITSAGGVNAAAALQGDYAQISVEALIEQNPDFIILGDADFGMTPELVAARGGWNLMTAVLQNQVYPIDSNTMSVPGPRLVDGLETVARLLHPELFE